MKKIISGILSAFLFVFYCKSIICAQNQDNEINELQTSLRTIAQTNLSIPVRGENSIVFIGPSGGGKSTLITYLSGRELNIIQGARGNRLDTNNPLPGFNIGHGIEIGTRAPSLWRDTVNNFSYYDIPGFEDTRGARDDIINLAYLKRILQSGSNIKLVLVIPESSLLDRSTPFLNMVQNVTSYFNNINQIINSFSFIISKQRDIVANGIFREIVDSQTTLNEYTNNPLVRQFITFMANNSNERVCSFPYPNQGGAVFSPTFKDNILRTISNSRFCISPPINDHLVDRGFVLLDRLQTRLLTNIINYITNDFRTIILNHCLNRINSDALPDILRTEFNTLFNNIYSVNNINDPDIFYNTLRISINNVNNLQFLINQLNFLRTIRPNMPFNTNGWYVALGSSLQILNQLRSLPQSRIENGVLKLEGFLVTANDVNQSIIQNFTHNPQIIRMEVISFNSLYINNNIVSHARYGQLPLSLSMIAPRWRIIGDHIIDLSGVNGANGINGTNLGQHGNPGYAGGNGGNFFTKGAILEGRTNFVRINTNGGIGGIGGDGMRGYDGQPGLDGDLERSTQVGNTYNFDALGTNGQNGGIGGRGGQGGLGGYQGNVIVDGFLYNHIPNLRQNGAAGNPGAGGIGGRHGRHCEGTYVTGLPRRVGKRVRTWGGMAHTTEWSIVNDATQWTKPKGYQEQRGNAQNGTNDLVLNQIGSEIPQPIADINRQAVVNSYRAAYQNRLATPIINLIVRQFPGL